MSERKAILISHDGNYHCTRCGAHDFFDCCENSCSKNPALTAIKLDGSERKMVNWELWPKMSPGWIVVLRDADDEEHCNPAYLNLTPPDSWEKLFEDLDRCIKESSLCMYYSTSGSCYDCTIFDDNSEVCDSRALRDIKDRIRKLAEKED